MPPASPIQQQRDELVFDDATLHADTTQQASKNDAVQQADATPRLNHPGTIVLPEQVVGSSHEFPVVFPYNLDQRGRPAIVTAIAMDDSFKLTATEKTVPSLFGPAGKTPPVASAGLVFTPQKPGVTVLIVQFNGQWSDGHTEQLEVQVIANARSLDTTAKNDAGAGEDVKTNTAAPPDTRTPTLAIFNSKVDELALHLRSVADSQIEGVNDVAAEAAKYTEPTPAPPTWAVLAELAITIGTAGVAAIVGKYIATKVVGLVAGEAAAAQTVAKDAGHAVTTGAEHAAEHSAVHAAEHAAEHSAGHVATEAAKKTEHVVTDAAKHGAEHAAEHADEHAGGAGKHYAIEGLASGFEDAIKDSVKLKIPEHEEKEKGEEEGEEEPASMDPRIAFFSNQRTNLREAHVDHGTGMIHLIDGLRGLAQGAPEVAIKAVEAIQGGLEAGKRAGPKHQREASAAKWVDFVAQGKHGTAKAGAKTVTKMDELHKQMPDRLTSSSWGTWLNSPAGKGVMEITVDVDDDLHISVDGARLDGVSRLIGDRLLKMDLRAIGVPIRLNVTNTGYRRRTDPRDVITVDEAGNVRTGGPRQYEKNTDNEGDAHGEAQNIQGATHIVDKVLAKTLSQWGISHVESDDKSK
jgi:hypothetical protein